VQCDGGRLTKPGAGASLDGDVSRVAPATPEPTIVAGASGVQPRDVERSAIAETSGRGLL
jgi:hypothetical protein